ncbi:MAG: ribosome biogenesis protein [Nitrososphaerota archaeon]|nr:ribosome biogenesis protein [Nitrososphaerota archaeon]
MISFVLAESALELAPKEIWGRPAVASDARRRGKKPGEILLDRSFHHSAMERLPDSEKRGRPDLVHVALLSVTGTPLYLDGRVRAYVHTWPGRVIEVAEKTRIPKNYIRFRGLMEEALAGGSEGGLLRVHDWEVKELVRRVGGGRAFGLSVLGRKSTPMGFAEETVKSDDPVVVVGGFPHGHFSKETAAALDEVVRVHPKPLEAHVVAARVLYEIEMAVEGFND